ncbi:SDR family oxidoreductase [Rhizobium sp. 9T]|uniref:SDR family oxidoreductase n=1 Tax=Rhizobium croatiense TaxID=2867516 RepID=A0ABS7LYU2_9HYPH|nr:SDR family NAD(P)-dependent oxidoreductase [Rhizobium croatiense]MBY4610139.1 SDR family oxidoreductase [Rhizobium croatiense]MBY4629878.1 SDR family oxidoreductase [Rhizobium croatiense]
MALEGKSALVTGAGSGIGKAAALKLAAEGARVAVLSRTESEVQETCNEIVAAGGRSIALTADTSDESQMRAAIDRMTEAFGGIDIVVANAGINGVWAPIDDLKPDEWDQTMAVNLRGTYLTLHLTVPYLKRNGGSIVVVSSINGTRTFTTPGATAYTATKAAQVAMVQQLALELGKHRIRINAVCPGAIETGIAANTTMRHREETEVPVIWPEGEIPITNGKKGSSEDVAEAILFLASDHARHITGTPIWIDGGQSLLR